MNSLLPIDQERNELAQALDAMKPVSMSVPPDSEFALNLWTLIGKHQPTRIIETGTYIGVGTTAIIGSALQDLIDNTDITVEDLLFITIEQNIEAIKIARDNLKKTGFDLFTQVYHGLTVPRGNLPTPQEIKDWVVDGVKDLPIEVDHHEADRVYRYYAETADTSIPDDQLGVALRRFDGQPDLVMLDSGGHIGLEEFTYLLARLEGPCFIALDDIFHVKHYRSLQMMLSDPRFDIRCMGKERYGYAIVRFEP